MTMRLPVAAALLGGVAALLLFVAPEPALAQCAMCRTALEQNPEAAASFNRGILFLLGTPYALFGAGAFVVFRRRRAYSEIA